jgi:hypothetical protein
MIMLIVITIMITTAFSLSTINLRSVGNVQVREEALSAAQAVIEDKMGTGFALDPTGAAETGITVDIATGEINATTPNGSEYLVDFLEPRCVRATRAASTTASSVTLPGMTSASAYNTIWELDATATDSGSGAKVQVIHGVRVLLSAANKTLLCG